MSSTQHQLIEQCATRLRGIVEALDNIHDNTPHRWSTDLDDVHSSAESLLALIKDQAPARSEASFEEWLANELEGEDGQPVPAAVCDIALARRAFNHWPKLEQPAKVGGVRFSAGVSSRLVVEAAQRLYEFESTPEKEAERIERLQAFREQLDPLNLAPHAEAFNEAPADALRPEQAEAERPEGPTEDELEAAGLGYPLHKEEAVKLWYSGFRSEVITVLEAWEAIGHDIGMNPDKGELLDSLRYMLEKCEAHDAALAEVAALRAELQSQRERNTELIFKLGSATNGWGRCEKERDAAQAKLAELEKQEPVAAVSEETFSANGTSDIITRNLPIGTTLYAAPVAPAQHSVPQAWLDVQAERRRQITAEGWTPEHDDLYCAAELPRAAAAYILNGANDEAPAIWPFVAKWWKPRDARSNYVRASALILAEIERLDRAGISQSPQPGATTASS
ncbi:hypothetical protein [Pseudomonas aeruginosa]|uniref:hypothetical protein n=1 Tax=Pseudomonas aeruginosa TaxID=287 RepID=UPI00070D71FF|nr:hypothetical protein [Pseudomonas aeruginosa]